MGEVKKFYATDYETDYANGKRGQVLVVKASDYATLEADNAKLRAELERREDGWKLVPVEPTEEMICAGNDAAVAGGCDLYQLKREVMNSYTAMLAAAPSAPKADDPVKQMLLEALGEIAWSNNSQWQADRARAAIAAARKGEVE